MAKPFFVLNVSLTNKKVKMDDSINKTDESVEKKTFDEDYVHQLREEAKQSRIKAAEAE
jgi:hypothetical protein